MSTFILFPLYTPPLHFTPIYILNCSNKFIYFVCLSHLSTRTHKNWFWGTHRAFLRENECTPDKKAGQFFFIIFSSYKYRFSGILGRSNLNSSLIAYQIICKHNKLWAPTFNIEYLYKWKVCTTTEWLLINRNHFYFIPWCSSSSCDWTLWNYIDILSDIYFHWKS